MVVTTRLSLIRCECWYKEGMKAYMNHEYDDAIDHFTLAIDAQPDNMDYLNNRSKAYEKLKIYDYAMTDANNMIELDKMNKKGYLRAARVAILQKDKLRYEAICQAVAILNSTFGNHYFTKEDEPQLDYDWKMLLDAHATMEAEKAKMDILIELPREIMEMVFEYLSYRTQIAVTRVSKMWRERIMNNDHLWWYFFGNQSIMDELGNNESKFRAVKKLVESHGFYARSIAIFEPAYSYEIIDTFLSLRPYPSIQNISLSQTGWFRNFRYTDLVQSLIDRYGSTLREFRILAGWISSQLHINEMPQLKIFECQAPFLLKMSIFPQLESLTLAGDIKGDDIEKLRAYPHVKSLTLSGSMSSSQIGAIICSFMELERIQIKGNSFKSSFLYRNDVFQRPSRSPEKLTHLSIFQYVSQDILTYLLSANLKTLTWHGLGKISCGISFSNFFSVLSKCRKLEQLSLQDVSFKSGNFEREDFELHALTYLKLAGEINMLPWELSKLFGSCPALRIMELIHISYIDCYCMSEIGRSLKNQLHWINIERCSLLTCGVISYLRPLFGSAIIKVEEVK